MHYPRHSLRAEGGAGNTHSRRNTAGFSDGIKSLSFSVPAEQQRVNVSETHVKKRARSASASAYRYGDVIVPGRSLKFSSSLFFVLIYL